METGPPDWPAGPQHGDGEIRTLDTGLTPYNGLANRRLQPLGHVSNYNSGVPESRKCRLLRGANQAGRGGFGSSSSRLTIQSAIIPARITESHSGPTVLKQLYDSVR